MQEKHPKDLLRNLSFFYWVMLLSLVTFIVASAIYINKLGPALGIDPQAHYIVNITVILLIIVIAPISYILPQKMIAAIDRSLPLEEKLIRYRLPLFVRYFFMDTAGFSIAVGFILTGNTNLILMQAIVMLFFIIYKPTPFKIAADLELNDNEKQKLMSE